MARNAGFGGIGRAKIRDGDNAAKWRLGPHSEYAVFSTYPVRNAPWSDRISQHAMPLSAGTRLGPYEILALIGAGGMGEVYRARDPRMGREVAIKSVRRAVQRPVRA